MIPQDGSLATTVVTSGKMWSAMHWAALGGFPGQKSTDADPRSADELTVSKSVMKLLLDAGGNPSIQDHDGQTPLHTAVFVGREDLTELLINVGADLNLRGGRDGVAPLHWVATKNRNPEIARRLVLAGAQIDIETGVEGMTALMLAADAQNHELVRVLLELGADPNHITSRDIVKPMLHITKGTNAITIAVTPSAGTKGVFGGPTMATFQALLDGGADPLRTDAEYYNTMDRSRCREGAGWLKLDKAKAEFRQICSKLRTFRDESEEQKLQETEVGQWLVQHLRKRSKKPQLVADDYAPLFARMFFENGITELEHIKRIRNEMDLLQLGVRHRAAAQDMMDAIRSAFPDYYASLEDDASIPAVDFDLFPKLNRTRYADVPTMGMDDFADQSGSTSTQQKREPGHRFGRKKKQGRKGSKKEEL